jgi:hypothetical protein
MTGRIWNVGSDSTITILVNGQVLGANILTNFEAKQVTVRTESTAITGKTLADDLEKGWDLDITWDRGDSNIDDYFVRKEAGRYAGQRRLPVSILLKINNPDGSVSRYRFESVTLKLDSIGAFKGDDKVEQKVSGFASRMIAA